MTMAHPSFNYVAVTPSDSADLPTGPARALYIGGAGTVIVWPIGSTSPVTFVGANSGTVLPVQCRRVISTGTTATNIVALA